jgi:error-prone DNA polymerase
MSDGYVELHAASACSFLRGASHPEALAGRAAELGMGAMALCDWGGVYGSARMHAAGRERGVRAIVGAELPMADGSVVPVLVANREGYRNLCRMLTRSKLRGTKAEAPLEAGDWAEFGAGLVVLTGDERGPVRRALARGDGAGARAWVERMVGAFGRGNVCVEVQRHLRRGEARELVALRDLAEATGLPVLATNGVRYAARADRVALDLFTCVRHGVTLDGAGRLLEANGERHLKGAGEMAALFADWPEAVANSARVAERLEFSLRDLGYAFPRYRVPEGETMEGFLRKVAFAGARSRYSHLTPPVLAQLNRELELIGRLGFSGYFLIVWDLVNFCTEQGILAQGRGSAANSVVCYALGITACDPIACRLLFERFLSEGRTSWPDIDLDLPSGEARERVIQEVYRRYGPHGAAMTANVITFRGRSAMREIGKALGFSEETLGRFSRLFGHGDYPHTLELEAQVERAGIGREHPRAGAAVDLYRRIYGLPRHLGQHSGGMIVCEGELSGIVPLEKASMPGRVVAQWDKDDCEDLGIIKVDLLGLGMLAALQESLEICQERGRAVDLAAIPKDDAATYDLLCRADTIGTFQVESRAQIATLPRLRPREFYDVVVEVALIRPGPIQGEMVHPYLARRRGEEAVDYFDERLRPVLERTLGVPLFQEQLLKIAMVMAGFSGGEAEELRRALSFHRSRERMEIVCVKLRQGLAGNGVGAETAERIVGAVQSFAVYGFPESHAISFALIAYASCWMKVHRAPEFYAGLLNHQPMGFYSPATLVRDAVRRGVRVRPASVVASGWKCGVDADGSLRLGLCQVRGLSREEGERIVAARGERAFGSVADCLARGGIGRGSARVLAKAGAFAGLSEHRRAAQWEVEAGREELLAGAVREEPPPLRAMDAVERLEADYACTGLTVGPHPMALARERLPHLRRAADLEGARPGAWVRVGGMVICRQRPGTAKGVLFVSLEDETGIANAIVAPELFERHRLRISEEPFLEIAGQLQKVDGVIHVKARRIEALEIGAALAPRSHDFH